jgi:hypothetical protein
MTIELHLQARGTYDAQYIVTMGRIVKVVTVPVCKRRHRLTEYRHAINKGLRLNSCQYRFKRNVRRNGLWIQEWEVI